MRSLRIYRNHPDRMVLALRIATDDQGNVSFHPGDDHFEAAMRIVSGGVLSRNPLRVFTPDDGENYLMAVYKMLGHSSYWLPFADMEETPKKGGSAGRKKPAAIKAPTGAGSRSRRRRPGSQ